MFGRFLPACLPQLALPGTFYHTQSRYCNITLRQLQSNALAAPYTSEYTGLHRARAQPRLSTWCCASNRMQDSEAKKRKGYCTTGNQRQVTRTDPKPTVPYQVIPANVVGNSRRSEPNTTHTSVRTARQPEQRPGIVQRVEESRGYPKGRGVVGAEHPV
jgi:hypothetical protein